MLVGHKIAVLFGIAGAFLVLGHVVLGPSVVPVAGAVIGLVAGLIAMLSFAISRRFEARRKTEGGAGHSRHEEASRMATHRTKVDAPQTAGRVLHSARWYDLFGRVISFGRDKAIREKLMELASPAPGEKVLDVGCGTGTLAIAIRPRVGAGEVHGIDASPEMIEVANEKAAESGSDVDFQVALIEAIPFPDGSFDLVTSSLMLHHLPDDLKARGFREIRRVLKPGGRFMGMDFAAESHSHLGHLLSFFGHSRGEGMDSKLMSLLKDAGFSDVECIPTRHKSFAFIRACRPILEEP